MNDTAVAMKRNHVYQVKIDTLSHEGRGIASLSGQRVFIEGALPGEEVTIKLLGRKKKIWSAAVESVQVASPDRQKPPCEFAEICGGCSLQHMNMQAQHALKEATLKNQLKHFGQCEIESLEPKLHSNPLGYRKKARLGVRYVSKKGKVLVGFREKNSAYLADMTACEVVDPRVGHQLESLQTLIAELDAKQTIPQIEVAASDDQVALVFRHLESLSEADQDALIRYCQEHQFHLYLQPKGPASVHRLLPKTGPDRLYYTVDGLKFGFHPMDFTQVNSAINQQMIQQAMAWLDLQATDEVLDLFCGLGNFTLPIAKRAARVLGVEASDAMVERGYENAKANQLQNADFVAADLMTPTSLDVVPWHDFSGQIKVLLDPPRSGAEAVVQQLRNKPVHRIVYVSCNAATLARDTAILLEAGFKCMKASMMDMFPHTHHMESMAVFER